MDTGVLKTKISYHYMIAARLSWELKAHKADTDPSAKIIVTGSNKLLRKTLVEIAWEESPITNTNQKLQ